MYTLRELRYDRQIGGERELTERGHEELFFFFNGWRGGGQNPQKKQENGWVEMYSLQNNSSR